MDKVLSPARLSFISTIWIFPIVLVMLESLIFIAKAGWHSHNLFYYISFWTLRILLTPMIIYYTHRFWVEPSKKLKLITTHLAGFILFSIVFTTLAYLILYRVLTENEFPFVPPNSSKAYIYGLIADNSISINVMVYLTTVVIYYTLEYSRRVVEANKKALALETSLVNSRLDLLKNQLNNHFLFNTLHTINSLVTRKQIDEASDMIIKLSDLLRFILTETKKQLLPLRRELEMLQLYIDIIQTRFGDRLEFNIVNEKGLYNYLIPAFVLQPLVENAVKHAIEPLTSKGVINIQIRKGNDKLEISIADNGKIPFSDINFSNGIGLNNTRERLQKLYGDNWNLSFQPNKANGICVTLEVPLQTVAVYGPEYIDS